MSGGRGIDYSKFDKIEDSDDEKPQQSKPSAKPAETPCCSGCGKDVAKPLRCSQCQRVVYCSPQCQRSDWAYHKRACRKPEGPKAAPPASASNPGSDVAVAKRSEKGKAQDVVVDDDETLTWYRHREWKPVSEPKQEYVPTPIAGDAAFVAEPASARCDGSAWNAAGTWEDRDVTEFAKRTLLESLTSFSLIDVAGGALDAEDVTDIQGEASKPVVRGKRRHLFDFSFKCKFSFKWMDSTGQRRANGAIEVSDFTNDVYVQNANVKPDVRLVFSDIRLLDSARKQAVEAALGVAQWPPSPDTLMGELGKKLEEWVKTYEKA